MKYKVSVDREKCIACGACQVVCPDVFDTNEDGTAKCLVNETDDDCVKEAADSCPVMAINIEETGE
ncbi:MAG: ferredoxin [Candidatus Woesearchaeota archaeon]|nr:ferredoxin [Candidatus Woesearchaeota archaeon]